jgi:hypothetical protein
VSVSVNWSAHEDASAGGSYDEESVHDYESPETCDGEPVSGAEF